MTLGMVDDPQNIFDCESVDVDKRVVSSPSCYSNFLKRNQSF